MAQDEWAAVSLYCFLEKWRKTLAQAEKQILRSVLQRKGSCPLLIGHL